MKNIVCMVQSFTVRLKILIQSMALLPGTYFLLNTFVYLLSFVCERRITFQISILTG